MICLDTNIAIYVINRRVPAVRLRLAEQLRLGTEIGFSAVALFELRYGHARSTRRAESDRLLAEFLAPGIAILTAYSVPKAVATGYTLVLHVALWLPITALGALFMLLEHIGWGDFGRAVEERGLEVSP